MNTQPKTTIWRNSPDGPVLVSERSGILSPIPQKGQTVLIPNLGETICSGLTYSGIDNTVIEVALTLR